MKPTRSTALLLATLLTGCHVVDRAERCGELSRIIKKSAPEIAATELTDSPPAKTLRKKARLYGQLAEKVQKIHVNQPQVKAEQQGLVLNLETLEKHLLEAAEAVEAHRAFLERQRDAMARHEEILAQKETYAARSDGAPQVDAAADRRGADLNPKPTAQKEISPKGKSPVSRGGLPGFLDRARQHAPPGKRTPPPPGVRASAHTYSYERAKIAAEAASRLVETSNRNLENACR